MRLWSIHPQYLDAPGLVALWREALLAQAVLAGRTRGYTHHPQLARFREQRDPAASIARYLHRVADEADRRGYSFDRSRIGPLRRVPLIAVTDGQLAFELQHLRKKLRTRNGAAFRAIRSVKTPDAHPSFSIRRGPVAEWERAIR